MPSPTDPPAPFPDADPPPLFFPPDRVAVMPATPWDPALVQWVKDEEHLRMLSIGHYVVGGMALLFSSFFIIYILFGVLMLNNSRLFGSKSSPTVLLSSPAPAASPNPPAAPDGATAAPARPATPAPFSNTMPRRSANGDEPPAFLGYIMISVGSAIVLLGWTFGALLVYSGRCLARRTRRVFTMVLAGISCLQMPLGTLLGVFTLTVLQRPTVRALYAAHGPGQSPSLPR